MNGYIGNDNREKNELRTDMWGTNSHMGHRQVWGKSLGNERGRRAQGMPNRVNRTDTIFFIDEKKIPKNRRGDATYGRIACDFQEGKTEKKPRLKVGGNRIKNPGDVGTPRACLLTVNC